jgi:hypothetical protein
MSPVNMPPVRIICLANSWKHGDRCIAGIDPNTGEWIRPVSHLNDGRVPKQMRLIDGEEPQLLDLLEIPLADDGPDFGFEKENRSILPGKWRRVGRVHPQDAIQYCEPAKYILHNSQKYVPITYMRSLPVEQRRTLELILVPKFSVTLFGSQWKSTIVNVTGAQLSNLNITDPVFVEQLAVGYRPTHPCLVTVSLGMPWRPRNWEGDDPCWKLIAAVVELH